MPFIPAARIISQSPNPVSTSASAYSTAVLADSPTAFWKCQDVSGNPVDSSGNANDMTSISAGVVYQAQGPFGNDFAITFPSTKFCSRASVVTATTNFTLECWLNFAGFTTNQTILHNSNDPTFTKGYDILSAATTGTMVAIAQGVSFLSPTGTAISTGVWCHVVMQRAASLWLYYLNGRVDMSNAGASAPAAFASCNTGLGAVAAGSQFTAAYYAQYNSLLSPSRILAHYTAGLFP